MTSGLDETRQKLKELRQSPAPETDEQILAEAMAQYERTAKVSASGKWQIVAAVVVVFVILALAVVMIFRTEDERPLPQVVQEIKQTEPSTEVEAQDVVPDEQVELVTVAKEQKREPVNNSDAQQRFLRIAEFAAAGDINSLVAAVHSGDVISRLTATRFLSEIDDERVAIAVEELATEMDVNEPNDYLIAAAIGLTDFGKEQAYIETEQALELNEPDISQAPPAPDNNDVNDGVRYSQTDGIVADTQQGCALFGYIVDDNNEPIVEAVLDISAGTEKFTGRADSQGWYELQHLPDNNQFTVTVFAGGFGYNSFDYTCIEPNVRLDVQIYPPGYDWYGLGAPPWDVQQWLNFEPGSLYELKGKIVVLCLGDELEEKKELLKKLNELIAFYESDELDVIAVRSRRGFNEQKEIEIQQVLEELNIDFAFGIDAAPEVSSVKILPEAVEFDGDQVTIIRKGETDSGATHSLYDVRTNGALYLIDEQGVLIGCFTIEQIGRQIETLFAW